MKKKVKKSSLGSLCLLFFAFHTVSIFAQAKESRPTISVLDFTVSGISQAESTVLSSALERSGWSLDIQGGVFVGMIWSGITYMIGDVAVGSSFQFNNFLSLGVWCGANVGIATTLKIGMPTAGIKLILGNKVDGFAMSANLGLPPSIGLYFRNWYVNAMWMQGFYGVIDLGYSFYFEK